MKVLGEDIVVVAGIVVVADIVVDIVVVGVEADAAGWVWGVDTDMVRGDLSGQTDGTQDFMGHARTAVRTLGTEPGDVSIQA
jgi:hypothetical protein